MFTLNGPVTVELIPLGNAIELPIPKAMLDQCGFDGSAEIAVEDGHLVVRPTPHVRHGWDDAFRQMAQQQDDRLLDTPSPVFDDSEWTW